MKVLCIHGIGHQEAQKDNWQPAWAQAINDTLNQLNPAIGPHQIDFLDYDNLFEAPLARLGYTDFATALGRLVWGRLTRPRGLFDLSEQTRWYPGMVVVWVNQPQLRKELRDRFAGKISDFAPDLILAHSLGSLVAYDTFAQDATLVQDRALLTFGSQIGNPYVVGSVFAGRIGPLPTARHWYHLFNPNDHVFTATLNIGRFQTAANFTEIETKFGADVNYRNWWREYTTNIAANHTAVDLQEPDQGYLTHPQAIQGAWRAIAGTLTVRGLTAPVLARSLATRKTPDRRALLVGINEYPDVNQRLEGCVNDVFLMSSVLQECNFQAEDIRVVLDDRATADGIRDRLHWLLDGVDQNDMRFFYYSGHGAQLPTYGPEGTIDHVQSCLAPHDFDWTAQHAITDEDLLAFYSQLPYEANFMMMLDCCYSGGLTRGSGRPRGLEPPDDIRHRMLRWDKDKQMWVDRSLTPLNPTLARQRNGKEYLGENKATVLLGRGVALRSMPIPEFKRTRARLHHEGPFMPIVYEACGENELSYEYQHGAIGHGAFTYALAAVLRRSRQPLTFTALLKETAKVLKEIGYDQTPRIAGPKDVIRAQVPWLGTAPQPPTTEA
jgi:hypothetical protein